VTGVNPQQDGGASAVQEDLGPRADLSDETRYRLLLENAADIVAKFASLSVAGTLRAAH